MTSSNQSNTAYILLSGGQDSFVCLAWALENFKKVEAISIDYGQKHIKELEYAQKIANHYRVPHQLYSMKEIFKFLDESTLLNSKSEHHHSHLHALAKNLPSSFVPNRNGLFLSLASNHAFKKREKQIHLVTGVCETDFSGYPDCRDVYIKAKSVELSLGLDRPVSIHTPLMWKSKAETFAMAFAKGHLKKLLELTLTCYQGVEDINSWGRGCSKCPACLIRKKGYLEFEKQKMKK